MFWKQGAAESFREKEKKKKHDEGENRTQEINLTNFWVMDCGVGWRHSYSLEPREAVRKEMTQEWGSTAWRRRRRRE